MFSLVALSVSGVSYNSVVTAKLSSIQDNEDSSFAALFYFRLDSLRAIDQSVQRQFLVGNWHYIGSESHGNIVQLYVSMPEPHNVEPQYRSNYIQQSLCPTSESALWRYVSPTHVRFICLQPIKKIAFQQCVVN